MSNTNPIVPIGDRKYLCIEYPGYVKNVDKVIHTLGGEKKISESLSTDSPLQLRYRPKDIFSHPITGDLLASNKLVVKVTRRVKKNTEGEIIEQDPEYKTEILGTAIKTVRFRALADFQYLLPKENKTKQLKEALTKGDVEKILQYKIATDDDDLDNLRSIPPPIFSPIETPFSYNYRQNASVIRVRVRQPDGTFKIKLLNRSGGRPYEVTSVRFEEENIPSKSWHYLKELTEDIEKEADEIIKGLYESRPIWTRFAVLCHLDSKYHKYATKCLVRYAYFMISGPWRDTWIKYGVDPRKDQAYYIYQQTDIRRFFNPTTRDNVKTIRTRRNAPVTSYSKQLEQESKKTEYSVTDYVFDGVHVNGVVSYLLFCDITDPDITPLLQNPNYLKPTCSKHAGFFYECVHQRIRKAIRKKYVTLMEGGIPEHIVSIELGLSEEIKKEIEANKSQEEEEGDSDTERATKEAYKEINSNQSSKRLKDVVDEYMTDLENVNSNMAKELQEVEDIESDILEEYEEEEDLEEEEQVANMKVE